MAIWVGGDEQIFNRHKPVLDAMGDHAAYIGPIGAGSIAKLVHNCTSAVMGVALAEVFTMGSPMAPESLIVYILRVKVRALASAAYATSADNRHSSARGALSALPAERIRPTEPTRRLQPSDLDRPLTHPDRRGVEKCVARSGDPLYPGEAGVGCRFPLYRDNGIAEFA